ncbi:MAG: response regulator [Candidatus Competibacteraceae bacterium]
MTMRRLLWQPQNCLKSGFSVAYGQSLAEAKRILTAVTPAVLLLDVILPDGSGLELIETADPDKTRIVVMTAHPTVDIAIDSLRARVSDFLVKPIEPKRLLASMQALQEALTNTTPIQPSDGGNRTMNSWWVMRR